MRRFACRNQQAADVANAVTTWLTAEQAIYKAYGQETNSLGLIHDAVVIAEPISNSLLVSATPEVFDYLLRMIANIDTTPPQVLISVLIAEVTMNGVEEFGMEVGLQNPISFLRGFVPGTASPVYSTGAVGIQGFFFNNPPSPSAVPSPGLPGYSATTNHHFGVGRTSPVGNAPDYVSPSR